MREDATLRALRLRREDLVARCDAQRHRAGEVLQGLTGGAVLLRLLVRGVGLVKNRVASAAVLGVAFALLKRQAQRGFGWRGVLVATAVEFVLRITRLVKRRDDDA